MHLLRMLNYQFKVMLNKKSFMIAFSIVLIYCLFSYLTNVISFYHVDISQMMSANSLFALSSDQPYWGLFATIFPFILFLPFAFSYIEDRKIQITNYIISRSSSSAYLISQIVITFLGGFIITFVPFLLNLLLCHVTFPDNMNTYFGEYGNPNYYRTLTGSNVIIHTDIKGLPFLELYLNSQLLYNLIFLLMFSVASGLLSVFILSLSYMGITNRLILFIPLYLFFYLSRALDSYSYNSSLEKGTVYHNYDWLTYLTVDSFYGKNYNYLLYIALIILLIIVVSYIVALFRLRRT